ncbi:MAG: hypothetical protein PF441_03265 [Desulfuromusa sp.]|jgi:hypothetical protein|nr:hypothetical protein [Desulfuromusa sp.]
MVSFLKKLFSHPEPAKPKKQYPPSRSQYSDCKLLGLTIEPGMGYYYVKQMIEEALQKPQLKTIMDTNIAKRNAIYEQEEREEYGDALVDELKKWEKICDIDGQYLVIYKKGKTLSSDIVQFDGAQIETTTKKPYVKIEASLPKVFRGNGAPYIDWDKDTTFRPKQILEVKKLKKPINDNVELYDQILAKAKKLEAKYL